MDKNQEAAASAARPTDANQATTPQLPQPATFDPPPSYKEAMGHPIVESANQPSMNPSAPPMEASGANLYNAQGLPTQQNPPYPYAQADGQFSAWDDRATRMLIIQRLEMEERFRRAQNQQEQNRLWDLILLDLNMSGYDFFLFDVIRFWEFQFHIYKSIVDGLTSGSHTDSNWPYFEPMDSVFKGSTDGFSSTAIGSSILDQDYNIVPHVPVQPLAAPPATDTVQSVTEGSTIAADVNATTNNSTLTSAVTGGGGDNSTLTTLPAVHVNEINENVPFLMSTDDVSNGAVTIASAASPADNVASGLTDLGSTALASEATGTSIFNDVTSAPVITAQPDSIAKILTGDGDVVTTQPLSMGLSSMTLDPIQDHNHGCCDGDGCCGDDGCCGNDGCCGDHGCCGEGGCDDGCCDGCGDGGCDGCDACDGGCIGGCDGGCDGCC